MHDDEPGAGPASEDLVREIYDEVMQLKRDVAAMRAELQEIRDEGRDSVDRLERWLESLQDNHDRVLAVWDTAAGAMRWAVQRSDYRPASAS